LTQEMMTELKALPDLTFATAKNWDDFVNARTRHAAVSTLLAYPAMVDQRRANLERRKLQMIEEVNEL
jgi:hypothetical protein